MNSILFAALSTFASRRFNRADLAPGDHSVALKVTGTVDGEKINQKIAGQLSIAESQARTSRKTPGTDALLAAVLYQLPPRKRNEVVEKLLSRKALLTDDEADGLATRIIAHHTKLTQTTVNGSISFGEA